MTWLLQLGDVTRGLIYMHDQGIVHGNLKGVRSRALRSPSCSSSGLQTNILINRAGQACLADFSLLTMVSDQSTIISSWVEGGTIRWMSPELLDPERFGSKGSRPTKQSDCYALGMVVYEVLSGQPPFAPSTAPVVIRMILEGKRPGRPQGEEGKLFTDAIWGVLELCWKPRPSDRASVRAVLLSLGGNQEDEETDSDDQSDITAKNSRMFSLFRPGFSSNHTPGIQDLRLRIMTAYNQFHHHGAVRAGHRLGGWRAEPGKRSNL